MFAAMRKITVAGLALFAFVSCNVSQKEHERKPVPPPGTETSQIPWNSPVPGQGGGMMGALPKTPRR